MKEVISSEWVFSTINRTILLVGDGWDVRRQQDIWLWHDHRVKGESLFSFRKTHTKHIAWASSEEAIVTLIISFWRNEVTLITNRGATFESLDSRTKFLRWKVNHSLTMLTFFGEHTNLALEVSTSGKSLYSFGDTPRLIIRKRTAADIRIMLYQKSRTGSLSK